MPRAVENRQMIGLDDDSRKVIAALRRKNGKMTTNDAVNLAIRLAGTKLHIADVNETNELLHSIVDSLEEFPQLANKLTSQSLRNEAVLIRTFAYLRKLLAVIGEERGKPLIESAENDFKQHMIARTRSENKDE